jgi:hypothetical protein
MRIGLKKAVKWTIFIKVLWGIIITGLSIPVFVRVYHDSINSHNTFWDRIKQSLHLLSDASTYFRGSRQNVITDSVLNVIPFIMLVVMLIVFVRYFSVKYRKFAVHNIVGIIFGGIALLSLSVNLHYSVLDGHFSSAATAVLLMPVYGIIILITGFFIGFSVVFLIKKIKG